ncbi:MAG: ABC transporter permease [Desulfobacterales bacterium]
MKTIDLQSKIAEPAPPAASGLEFDRPAADTLRLRLTGSWTIQQHLPTSLEDIRRAGAEREIRRIVFDTEHLAEWDTSLLTFLVKVAGLGASRDLTIDKTGLPEGVQRLLDLASAVPERKGARRQAGHEPLLARIGVAAIDVKRAAIDILAFIGESAAAFGRLLTGKAGFQRSDLLVLIQDCGANALPIITLISVLVGLILAFIGAIQLKMFGAQIFVADLVGIAMVRVMGAVMAGIIMAGRTGAAFAAQIGTMQVNEEIDALKTLGISPMQFLVLPRLLALVLMLPLLCVYADLMGIIGGLIVGVALLDITLIEYINQTKGALTLAYFLIGIFQAGVFGVLVAMAGCLRGMQCGRSASAVGEAATSAVVTGIVSIVVATAVVTVVCNFLGI